MDWLRPVIRAEVAAIQPCDDLEQRHLAATLAWIDSGADLCRIAKPAVPPQHLVSYFAVIDSDQMLLVDHKLAGLWLPTGGHVEPGEHPRATVVRELKEELGLDAALPVAAPVMLTCTTTVGSVTTHTDVSLWYVVHADRRQRVTFDSGEFNAIQWFGLHELPFAHSDPHLKRFVSKLMAAA